MGAKTFINCCVAIFLSLMFVSARSWAEPPNEASRLLVVVYDDGGVERSIVERAEIHVAGEFQEVGIATTWRNASWQSADFTVTGDSTPRMNLHILARARTLGPEVFGMAFVNEEGVGQQADVFYAAIAEANSRQPQDRAVLLGAVMAHELGHLLLGPHAHSALGIMRGKWDEGALQLVAAGAAGFNFEQGQKMRERLQNLEKASQELEYDRAVQLVASAP